MSFEFLRQKPANISRYLPNFVYKDDKSLQKILDANSKEHEKQRLRLQDIAKQWFVETATWGLADWERIVDVKPNAGDNYTQRRNRILLKLQGTQTSTVEFMERLIKRYLGDNVDVKIIEYPEKYTFDIKFIGGGALYLDDMFDAVDIYKPAHLGYGVKVEIEKELLLNIGIVTQYGMERINTAFNLPDKDVLPLNVGAFLQFGIERIGANVAKDEKLKVFFAFPITAPLWDSISATKDEDTSIWYRRSIVDFALPMALG